MDINLWLILIQTIPFAAAILILNSLVYKPFLAYLAEREKNLDGYERDAKVQLEEVAVEEAKVEAEVAIVRGEASVARNKILEQTELDETQIAQDGQQESDRLVTEAMARIEGEEKEALSSLEADAKTLAGRVASRVLGRDVGAALGWLVLIGGVLFTSLGWAEAGGDHGGGHGDEAHGPPWYWIGAHAINLVIFLALAIRFGLPAVHEFLANRKADISQGLVRAEEMAKQAQQRQKDLDDRVAYLENEKREILEDAKEVTNKEREGRLERARRHAKAVVEGSKRVIADEEVKASNRVRVAVADRALALGTEQVRSELNESDEERMWGEFLDQLGKAAS